MDSSDVVGQVGRGGAAWARQDRSMVAEQLGNKMHTRAIVPRNTARQRGGSQRSILLLCFDARSTHLRTPAREASKQALRSSSRALFQQADDGRPGWPCHPSPCCRHRLCIRLLCMVGNMWPSVPRGRRGVHHSRRRRSLRAAPRRPARDTAVDCFGRVWRRDQDG